jgi:hypothetical protein
MREWERQRQADKRATVAQARKLVAELEAQLAAARLQRRANVNSTRSRPAMPRKPD